ncbi:tetratricopeptide repeat protein 7A [Dorcoceras hygrometricum]|uniref:Tetratricopeptide repeat protein 7A n=1 Tax=Dorcoceras hygrometricum TaxID=472368 RepID=A0A2Z7DAV3_9LAMI|nr:tetratricopeptide repeat protein 7A [Dorcoceras hygrometricum]
MSLFDLQDVCIVIGSLATLDLPMVVDLIGIYVLQGPYCMLTMTKWFLQALSVIPMGSWRDVARRFTMIRWRRPYPLPFSLDRRLTRRPRVVASCYRTCSDRHAEEIPFMSNSSVLLVQADEGFMFPIVDLIRRIYRRLHLKSQFPCDSGWSRAPRRQQGNNR